MSKPAEIRPLSESLDLVAREVTDLAALGDQLQNLIARLMAAGDPADTATLVEAQVADLLSQRLAGLAAYVRALATAAPADAAADINSALRVLTLAEQAQRLSDPSHVTAEVADPATFWD